MTFDLQQTLTDHHDEWFDLFAEYVNPQLARVVKTIGFSHHYVRGEGAFLYDEEGKDYLDFLAGYGVFNIGRNHPKIKKALKDAIDADLPSMVQMDTPMLAGLLARELLKKVGGRVERVFFTNSGTEAVEGAIKFARRASGRERILHLEQSFHGLTSGSLSLNGCKSFRADFGNLLPSAALPLNDIAALKTELQKGDVAAFVIEPVQGKGVYVGDPHYYVEAQALCRAYGALFIIDEVQTGFGRTGKWFAHHHYGLEPDIVTVAKGLSGGFVPVGAICYTKEIYASVFRSMEECVVHSNTFGRNALAMVSGLASLNVMEEENIVENAATMGNRLMEGLRNLMPRFEMLSEVRGLGLMNGIEFSEPKSFSLRAGWKLVHAVNQSLFGQMVVVPLMRDHRILSQVAGHNVDIVKILPPLIITAAHVDRFVNAFEDVMRACHKFPGSAWSVAKDLAMGAVKSRGLTSEPLTETRS